MTVRLQKLIAGTGIASRRKAEELIVSGRVTINGHVVKELGTKSIPSAIMSKWMANICEPRSPMSI